MPALGTDRESSFRRRLERRSSSRDMVEWKARVLVDVLCWARLGFVHELSQFQTEKLQVEDAYDSRVWVADRVRGPI